MSDEVEDVIVQALGDMEINLMAIVKEARQKLSAENDLKFAIMKAELGLGEMPKMNGKSGVSPGGPI
jgi:hypothetical protein